MIQPLHAYECLGACSHCKGSGLVAQRVAPKAPVKRKQKDGKRKRRPSPTVVNRKCPACDGSGLCEGQWRLSHGEVPNAPCRLSICCFCRPCKQASVDRCQVCSLRAKGFQIPPCCNGGCPRCGWKYVEWLSYDVQPENVILAGELIPPSRVRLTANGVLIYDREIAHG